MGERTQDLIKRLSDKGAETAATFRALKPEDWSQQVYTTGPEWDVRQVLCHFVSAERGFERIFAAALDGTGHLPEDFDLDQYNAEEVGQMDGLAPEELIAQFEQVRAGTIAFLERIEDADLERESWHPWFKWDKLEKFLKLVYRHNMIHERDVRKALETRQPVPPTEAT